jgi:hypothetical protein
MRFSQSCEGRKAASYSRNWKESVSGKWKTGTKAPSWDPAPCVQAKLRGSVLAKYDGSSL